MTKEQKDKWIKALRSGKYIQGKEALKQWLVNENQGEVSYCCLGVACEIGIATDEGDNTFCIEDNFLEIAHQNTLSFMNDTGKSFSEIADYIEQNL